MELYEELSDALAMHNRRNASGVKTTGVRDAVVALRAHQFLFEETSPAHFALIRSMRTALEPHFALSGSRLIVDEAEGFVGLVPSEDQTRVALTVEQTIILLVLRWVYETKIDMGEVETDGTVRVSAADVEEWYVAKSRRSWPKYQVLLEAVDLFESRGILHSAKSELDHLVIFVRSVIRLVTGDGFVGRVAAFAEAAMGRQAMRAEEEMRAAGAGDSDGTDGAPSMDGEDADIEQTGPEA